MLGCTNTSCFHCTDEACVGPGRDTKEGRAVGKLLMRTWLYRHVMPSDEYRLTVPKADTTKTG